MRSRHVHHDVAQLQTRDLGDSQATAARLTDDDQISPGVGRAS